MTTPPDTETARCRCGSGAHPRKCDIHPEMYRLHVAALNVDAYMEDSPEAEAASLELQRAEVAAFDAVRREERLMPPFRKHCICVVDREGTLESRGCGPCADARLDALRNAKGGRVTGYPECGCFPNHQEATLSLPCPCECHPESRAAPVELAKEKT